MSVLSQKLKKSGAADDEAALSPEEARHGLQHAALVRRAAAARLVLVRHAPDAAVLDVETAVASNTTPPVVAAAAAAAVTTAASSSSSVALRYRIGRSLAQLDEALETLREAFPDAPWPEQGHTAAAVVASAVGAAPSSPAVASALAQQLAVLPLDPCLACSGEMRELLDPCAWPPLAAARQFATKAGVLMQGGKRRVVLLLHDRLLVYKERQEEKHPPRVSLQLLGVSLDLESTELRVGPLRLRSDDRRDVLAWLLLLREAKHAVSKEVFFAGETHSAEEMPRSVTQFFEPLPHLKLDLKWRPSLSERWWQEEVVDENVLYKDGRVRAASPSKLIEKLLDETLTSHADVVTFLLTFESFLTPMELFDALASHFDRPQRGAEGFKMRPEQLRVITVVCRWLETAPQTFIADADLSSKVFGWMEWNFKEDRPVPYRKMMKAARLVYAPKLSENGNEATTTTTTTTPVKAVSPTSAPVVVAAGGGGGGGSSSTSSPPPSPADKALAEKEALRAAVRARMAAQNAVLGEKGSSRASQTFGRSSSMSLPSAAVAAAPSPTLTSTTNTHRGLSSSSTASGSTLAGVFSSTTTPTTTTSTSSSTTTGAASAAAAVSTSSHNLNALRESSSSMSSSQDLRSSMSGVLPHVAQNEAILPHGWTLGAHQELFEVHPLEIARQITLLDFALFALIPLRELHERGWLSNGGASCPNIMRAIGFFNHLSRAVATTILRLPRATQRAQMIATWLKIAAELRSLNNFSSTVSIMAGLGMAPAFRLQRTWALLEKLHPKEHASVAPLQSLTSSNSNWAVMRQALHSVQPPAVPYLGNFTSDLTFADQGNPSRLSETLINWDKCKLEAGIIQEVNLYRQMPYPFQAVPQIQTLVWSLATDSDNKLYEVSLQCEPRKK